MNRLRVNDIREEFAKVFLDDRRSTFLELLSVSFLADEDIIFGNQNDYCQLELQWYLSKSMNINDMCGKIPEIWKKVANSTGMINSNYGNLIFGNDQLNQFQKCMSQIITNKNTKRGVMIYSGSDVHDIATENGKNDFICTYSAHLIIRNNVLTYIVNMRSNDAVYGYKNDVFWHKYIHNLGHIVLKQQYDGLIKGPMYWNVGTLHVYEKHIKLVKNFIEESRI